MRAVLENTAEMGGMLEADLLQITSFRNQRADVTGTDCDTAIVSGLLASHALHGTSLTVDDLTSDEGAELGNFCRASIKSSGVIGRFIIQSLAIALRNAIRRTTSIETISRHRRIYMGLFQLFIEYVAVWDWGYTERLTQMRFRFRLAHRPHLLS